MTQTNQLGKAAGRATRREWIGLAVLALPCLLVAMDVTALYLAVPAISADLAPSSSQLLWITDIYGFLIAGSLITMGTLGDRIGRRRLLLIGGAAFAIASVIAAFSTSATMLIAARAILGVAGATLMPSTLSLISNMFRDPRERTVAIGVWATSLSAGAAIGPLLGGALLELFWWGSVFLLSVPVMALLLALGPRLLPEFRDPDPKPFDLASAALSLVAVLAVIYAIKLTAQDGLGATAIASMATGLAVGAVFVRRQRRLADPLIDLSLFRAPAFSTALAANTLALFAIVGTDLYVAQYLQLVLGLSPLQAGLWTLPSAAGFIAGSTAAPALARRYPAAFVVAGGLAIAGLGAAMLVQVDGSTGLAVLVTATVVIAAGTAQAVTLATDLIVGAAPPERAGAASAMSETATELGGALGVAILGSIGTAVYRSELADAVPSGVSQPAADAARDTLGAAVAAADRLPASVLDAAHHAFAHGLQVAAVVGALAMLATAVLAAILLREPRAAKTVVPLAAAPEPC
jgi:MFS transporter, DHA2 family, multidrug resistance protein